MDRKKLVLFGLSGVVIGAAIVIVLVYFFGGKGEKEPENLIPQEYTVSDTTVTAIPEQKGMTVVPLESEEEGMTGYSYENVEDVTGMLSSYVATLVEEGMCCVDDALTRLNEDPVIQDEEGEVYLARELEEGADGAQTLSMHMTWGTDTCTVELQVLPEAIQTLRDMTFMESVDYLYSLSPEQLGLPGDSMQDYRIYVKDGAVVVDNRVCMHLNVYELDPKVGTNVFVGSYLVTADSRYLYKLVDGQAVQIN